MKKRCSKCKQYKEPHLFYKNSQTRDGLRPDCKCCYKKRNNALYRRRKPQYYDNYYRKRYGITYQDYENMLKAQNYSCAICKNKRSNRLQDRKFHVDHCHKTNKVRGLLCHGCNTGLGHFKDNIELVKVAVKYLKKELSCQKY